MNLFFRNCLFAVLFMSLITACSNKQETSAPAPHIERARILYASGFMIEHFDDYTLVKVRNPWEPDKLLHQYVLIDRNKPQPKSLPEGTVVKIPVESIACISSVDATPIEMLGDVNKIKAMADTRYVKIPAIQEGLKEGKITDIGEFSALNIERLMAVSPDIIIVAPLQNMGYGKLETTGISIIESASYMEENPLGRAEWIRFIAAFLKKDEEAEKIMDGITARYLSLCEKVEDINPKPKVFSGTKQGSSWDVPGGKSYIAQLFHDAGAEYVWQNDSTKGTISLPYEIVYEKVEDADFWVIKSDKNLTYKAIKEEFEPYAYFKACRNENVIFSNTTQNNYYEEGTMNPDYILEDLIALFHPELFPKGHKQRYFELLKNEK